MWQPNPTWGSPKIVAEPAKLGIEVAKSTVEKYRPKRARPPSPTCRTFLDQHVRELVSIDFFIVPTAAFRVLFVFIVLAHDRRRIVHFNVTEHPTAQWTAQQIVEAFPFDTAPSYLIRDGDGIYGERVTRRIENLGIDEVVTAPASPWQNAYVERVIGTLRRELFDHVIVRNERHLKRLMSSYLDYYHPWRTHQSLDRDAPDGRPIRRTVVPYAQRNPATSLNSRPSTAFTMSIFRRLHEYSGLATASLLPAEGRMNFRDGQEFQQYYNQERVHASLGGKPPAEVCRESSKDQTELDKFRWEIHCRGLVQLPMTA